ncbi:Hypothetical predicted protein [Mytilus galloprovincialis]|uniref:Uncharacterized protein n=1 Tax=Mytilus galloprovincialis TaxID=29158 RepID=A0A8B6GNF5_MYTGA|nr:Hypothetical predicted protein [Mytilus galloprovincialis]
MCTCFQVSIDRHNYFFFFTQVDAFGDGIAIENISQWAACNPGMTNDTCNAVCPKIIRWSFYCGLACSTVLRRIETGSFSKNCTTI